ncbi:helix-turn-helix domain-containing protein [Lacrimispora sp.]|uniref:helix-turn-helix domain-containing protein n=1 Tax=Lacrimispora sp. TaxID=2719234 RepID=UPI0028A61CB3|nr:helix-turn-helix transcriptional regulator [Lacrimispora sp.]
MSSGAKIKSDSNISLGKNIKHFRNIREYSQAYMVKELQLRGCNTSKQSYSKYEKDIAHISASELLAIADILEIPIDKLFTKTLIKEAN